MVADALYSLIGIIIDLFSGPLSAGQLVAAASPLAVYACAAMLVFGIFILIKWGV